MICSSVSCSFDRSVTCFLCCVVTHFPFDSLAFFSLTVENTFFAFWIYPLLSPLFLNTHIISGGRIHIVYSQERSWLDWLVSSRRLTHNIQLICHSSKGIFNVVELVVAHIDLGVMEKMEKYLFISGKRRRYLGCAKGETRRRDRRLETTPVVGLSRQPMTWYILADILRCTHNEVKIRNGELFMARHLFKTNRVSYKFNIFLTSDY